MSAPRPTLFDQPDPAARTEGDRRRHSRQAGLILALFEAAGGGEVTGRQLYAVCRRPSARILELRRAGYAIELVRKDASGETHYRFAGLREPPPAAELLASRVRRLVAEFGADAVRSAVAAAVGGDR